MCCLNVWPSASLQLYIVAHCDKQLHAPGLERGRPQKCFRLRTMQMDLQETLCPFHTAKKIPPWKHALHSHFLKSYSEGVVRICEKVVGYFCHPFYSFCWIGVQSNIIIVVDYRHLSLNCTWTTHNCVCGAYISLCELNLASQNLVWNGFYTLACFFFL